jgi:hypothetical protein
MTEGGVDAAEGEGHAPLFPDADAASYRDRWQQIQADFVDDPRRAVEQADELVEELLQRLTETFARQRGGGRTTEELRVALRRYRSFLGRLLSL